ncbi:MAG TPA: carbonic anhydrase [Gaiellaceae bacterium]|nr:carbonic anhydrase [Gaiellaceae bacterium]
MLDAPHDRAAFFRTAGVLALGALPLARVSAALASAAPRLTPEAAIARLMAGNARFVSGKTTGGNGMSARRNDVAPGQRPFAAVLTCADSRTTPEYVFDQRLGDVFVCRVAGNILDADILGSLEYAVEHFGSSAIVVLGHQRCGAVTDSVHVYEHHLKAPGSVQSIVDAIVPAIRATKRGSLSEAAYVDAVIKTNARLVARQVTSESAILRRAVEAGHLRVVAGRYSLDTGRVALL